MTGVAGKSKGCRTCRRRRIKCDLQTPACQNCSRFGRVCEGYGRFPVFINRTPDGVTRRRPFEETELSPNRSHPTTEPEGDAPSLLTQASSPGPQIQSRSSEATRYVSWFHEAFVPAQSLKDLQAEQKPHWLHLVISLSSQQPALDEALFAISLTRFGRAFGDSAILEKGRQVYVQALGLLQQALYNEQLAMLDETLATVGVMIFYELLESASTTPEGWSKHVVGLSSLLKFRGPQRHKTLLTRRLFECSRHMLMMHAINHRKSSIFAEPEWQEDPWNGTEKEAEQMIFDSGLKLGGLLESADAVFKTERNIDDGDDGATTLSSDLADIFNTVHSLLGQNALQGVEFPKSPPFKEQPDAHYLGPVGISSNFTLKILDLGIKLTACVTGHDVARKAAAQNIADTRFSVLNSKPLDIETIKRWFNERRVALARDICRSAVNYLRDSVGIPGASRIIFPLRLAFEQLEASDAQYAKSRDLLQRLEGKGTEYIPSLERNESVASRVIHHKSPLYGSKESDESSVPSPAAAVQELKWVPRGPTARQQQILNRQQDAERSHDTGHEKEIPSGADKGETSDRAGRLKNLD